MSQMDETDVEITLNGEQVLLPATVTASLLRALRDGGFTGTKGACEQGECGSCSVLVDGVLVCSCLVPAVAARGASVTTIEGIVDPPLADALARHGAVQCGFCTPGFVVAIEAFLATAPATIEIDDVREALAGNLCRCTGYEGLLRAVIEEHGRRRS